MSNLYSVQGSITVKRLRNGDNLYISLVSDKPLYQSINIESNIIYPDFTNTAYQPRITPQADSQMNPEEHVPLIGHSWFYNYQPINFDNTENGGYKTSTNHGRIFKLHVETGALIIAGNLASKENVGNDTFTYKGVAVVQGVEYPVQKSTEFTIRTAASNPFDGFITVLNKNEQYDDAIIGDEGEDDFLYLTTILMNGTSEVPSSDYSVNWYKDNEKWLKDGNPVTGSKVKVTRGDVNGSQLFIAEFILKSSKSEVAQAAIVISDIMDDFQIRFTKVGDMVDINKDVVVTANVYSVKGNSEKLATLIEPNWRIDIMDGTTWNPIRVATTNSVTITTDDTDDHSSETVRYRDVVVVAEVEFKI